MERSKIGAILKQKCPRCYQGDLFINKNPFRLKLLTAMHPRCKCCGLLTEPEPGFYFGAMYCSYGFGVVIFAINFITIELYLQLPSRYFIIINTLSLLLLWPVIFRYARVLYLYIFVRYDKNVALKNHEVN
jgi:uncharacterized protein (DUF983 family)